MKQAGDELEPYLRALGAGVRAARQKLAISQEQLGFEANLDRTYVSGIERGVRNPTVRTLLVLAKALETKPSKLLAAAERRRR